LHLLIHRPGLLAFPAAVAVSFHDLPALAREFARPVAFNFGFQRLIFRCLFSASVPALPLLVPARKDVAPNLDELAAVPSKYLARKRFPSS
jgi:hypothetical protein